MSGDDYLAEFVSQVMKSSDELRDRNYKLASLLDKAYVKQAELIEEKISIRKAVNAVAKRIGDIPLSECSLYYDDIMDMLKEEGY